MPQYDYENDKGEILTITRSIHDELPTHIRSADMVYRRKFYPVGVIYNTKGFYTTDSANSITQWQRENMKGL